MKLDKKAASLWVDADASSRATFPDTNYDQIDNAGKVRVATLTTPREAAFVSVCIMVAEPHRRYDHEISERIDRDRKIGRLADAAFWQDVLDTLRIHNFDPIPFRPTLLEAITIDAKVAANMAAEDASDSSNPLADEQSEGDVAKYPHIESSTSAKLDPDGELFEDKWPNPRGKRSRTVH